MEYPRDMRLNRAYFRRHMQIRRRRFKKKQSVALETSVWQFDHSVLDVGPSAFALPSGATARQVSACHAEAFGIGGLNVFIVLRLGWPTFVHEGREQIDRNWKKRCRVVLAGNLAHGLQEAQL